MPNGGTKPPPKPHVNDPMEDSGCMGHYLNAVATIVNTMETSDNNIKVKLTNS